MPLQTIINPTLINDQINSLVEIAEQSGKRVSGALGTVECLF